MDEIAQQPRLAPLYRPEERFEISAAGLAAWHQSAVFRRLVERFSTDPRTALQSKASRSLIYHLIVMQRPERALEIGTYCAGTSELMALALWEAGRGRLDTIDPFGAERCPPAIAAFPDELKERVSFEPLSSAAYFDRALSAGTRFDFVLVDGNHEFEYARFDLECSARLIRPGGIIVLDNIEQPGPRLAVKLFMEAHPEWEDVAGVLPAQDPAAPLDMPTPSFPGTLFYVLRAPPFYAVRGAPLSFGPIATDSAAVDGVELELAAPARGTLHMQVFARTFGMLYPEELIGRCRVDLDVGDTNDLRIRVQLDPALRSEFDGQDKPRRIEVVLAFTGAGQLALRAPPMPYPARPV